MNPARPRPDWTRGVSAACWLVVAAVLVRMASGGWSLEGVDYVLSGAPLWAVVGGSGILIASVALVIGFLVDARWARGLSAAVGVAALVLAVVLIPRGHGSAWFLGAAALVAVVMAVRARG